MSKSSPFLIFLTLLLLIPLSVAKAEDDPLSVTTGSTADELVQCILGDGITYSNAQLHAGMPECVGKFTGGLDEIGFSQGIILSTGNAKMVEKSDDIAAKEDTTTNGGYDEDLTHLLGRESKDTCYLTFDIIPTNNAISFQYVLSSEEYEDSISYADLFGLFYAKVLDDDSNETYKNMAWVPDTNPKEPVSVGTVNQNCNTQYYRSNYGPNSGNIDTNMDGLTRVFTVNQTLTAGQKYRIKIAIADIGDTALDSNVFIKADSVKDNAAQYGSIRPESKLDHPTTYDVVIAREDGSDGTGSVDWKAVDTNGQVLDSGTLLFDDGVTELTLSIPIAAEKITLSNPTGGLTIPQTQTNIADLPQTGSVPTPEPPATLGSIDFTGTFLDQHGNPLPNMEITLHSTPVTTTTDGAGEFTFHNITLENHELIIVDNVGTELSRYHLTFGGADAFSYSINGQLVDIYVPNSTVTLDVTLNLESDGSVSISNITHYAPANNPKTGDANMTMTIASPLILILLLTLGASISERKKNK